MVAATSVSTFCGMLGEVAVVSGGSPGAKGKLHPLK
jgi:hypothetical protein